MFFETDAAKKLNEEQAQSESEEAFMELIYGGFTDGVRNMLESKEVDVDLISEKGEVPIVLAASTGRLNMVQLLVEHGAKVNVKNSAGIFPLLWAKNHKLETLVDYLVEESNKLSNQSSSKI